MLLQEIQDVETATPLDHERLWISGSAHVITPWHVNLDSRNEANKGTPIGTTKRGIGPAYADHASRTGLSFADASDQIRFQSWIEKRKSDDSEFAQQLEQNQEAWERFREACAKCAKFVADAEQRIRKSIRGGKKLLLEGAQGCLLDRNHGTYPYVTSSNTIAAGAAVSLGIDPRRVDYIAGIAKAYLTRVGRGPFPTELHDKVGEKIAEKGAEFGATTGRPRRCGWYDSVAMRYASELNGLDGIYLNKLDILTGFSELKIAYAYRHPTFGKLQDFPAK